MRTAILGAAVLVAMPFAVPVAAQETRAQASVEASADAQLEALTDAYYRYRLDQSGRVEQADGSTARGTALPSVTAEAQLARARQAKSFLSQLDALDTTQFSPEAQIDAAVLRHLLETEIGDARFREWEMPFDSDSNFWGYLAERGPLGSVEEYERYLAWLDRQQSIAPDKPYFMYFAPGAVHAPLHVSEEWIDKFAGQFDQALDVSRFRDFQQTRC